MFPSLRRWLADRPPPAQGARRAILITIALAAAVRLWCLATIPLIVTNDGVGYLKWAVRLVEHQTVYWPRVRTPGYPVFLAALFKLFGTGPIPILIAQHALGCLIAGLAAAIVARLTNRWWAVAMGVLIAIDPVMLGLECYALSETLSVAMLMICVALVLLPRRQSLPIGVALGASLGFLCLVRPAFQIVVPLLALAWLLAWRAKAGSASNPVAPISPAPYPWRRTTLAAALLAVGFLAATGPWLVRNYRAGIVGLSASNSIIFWVGVNQSGLLADDFPLPEKVRRDYDTLVRPQPSNDSKALTFVVMQDGWNSAENRGLLTRWAVHSVRSAPLAYARAVLAAVGWQLQFFPPSGRITHDELGWIIWRLSADGLKLGQPRANYNVDGGPEYIDLFAMRAGRPPLTEYFKWWSHSWLAPIPRILLFLTALAATLFAALRRDWPLTLTLLATLAYFAAHALFLLGATRYSLPSWAVWYITPPLVAAAIAHLRRSAHPPVHTAPG